ncbi:MAG: hypothetical protein V4628_07525 [Pseudomonadota bacterium]
MPEVSTVDIGMRKVHIYRFTGVVVDSQKSSHTSVTSHNNGQVSTYTDHYNEIFIQNEGGEEMSAEIGGSNVSVRVGNKVSILWGIVGNAERGPFTTVVNHDTGAKGHMAKGVNDVCGPPFYNMLIILFVFIGVLGGGTLLGGNFGGSIPLLVPTGVYFWWLTGRRRKLRAATLAAAGV